MNWTSEQIRDAGRQVAAGGFALAANMLHAFSEQRRRDTEAAERAGRKCVVCGKIILIGEDFVGVADGVIACITACDMPAARRLAAARVARPLLALSSGATEPAQADAPGRVVNAWEAGAT